MAGVFIYCFLSIFSNEEGVVIPSEAKDSCSLNILILGINIDGDFKGLFDDE